MVALASLLATSSAPAAAMAAPQVSGGRGVYVPAVMRTAPDIVPDARDHPGGRGWGGGGGWGGRGGWGGGRHDHDDGGAVLAGLLVLGGIAAIAVAASNADKHKQEQRRSYPDNQPDPGYGDSQQAPGARDAAPSAATGAGSIDAAVDTCVDEVERGADPVDTVDSVNNAGDGWNVQGRVRGGKPFVCRVTRDGQIRTLTVDGHAPAR